MVHSLKIKHEHLPLVIFAIFFLLANCFVIPYEGDDTYFLAVAKESNSLLSYVQMRFMTWTGRLTSELLIGFFSLLNLWIWRIVNTIIGTYFVYLLGQILQKTYVHTSKDSSDGKAFLFNSFVCVSFFIIPISVTTRACSWYTGSFYYLWPTLCCLLALLPYLKALFTEELTKKDYLITFLATLYAGFMEQTAAVLLCFGLLMLIYLYLKQHKCYPLLWLQVGLTAICLLISALSPGNSLRLVSETATWYPTFDELSLIQKLLQGMNWTHAHLLREQSFMLLSLSLVLFTLLLPKVKGNFSKIMCFIPSLYFIGMLLPFNQITTRATSFEYHYDVESILNRLFFNPMRGLLPSLIGLAVLIEIGILIYFVLDTNNNRYLGIIFYLAALSSGYILGLSPTIFASGPRIFFLTDILLLLISGIVLGQFLKDFKPNTLIWRLSIIIYVSMGGLMAIMYIGGIALKSIFKID